MPDKPDWALASMGIYVFERESVRVARQDADDPSSRHDFGRDVIPCLVRNGKAVAYRFTSSSAQRQGPRPTGATSARSTPTTRRTSTSRTSSRRSILYDRDWPIRTYAEITPPAKFVHDEDSRRGMATSSLVSGACIISGSRIDKSLLFTGVHAHSYSKLEHVVALPHVRINRRARLERVVIDRGVSIPEGLVVSEDPELDARRFRRTDSAILPDHPGQ